MKGHYLLVLLLCGAAAAATHRARAASPAVNASSGLSGYWALRFDSRNVPPAVLSQSVTAAAIAAHRRSDEHVIRWCRAVGTPFLMESTAPLDIVQGRDQIAITSEMPSAARHIYLNRTSPPDPETLDPTANGFSIGHWEGDTLWVHTTAFSGGGYTALPGGGYRTPTSELIERYQLVEHGRALEVTFTWIDAAVFRQPHTYAFRYYRVPKGFNAGESFCDPNDAERSVFLTRSPEALRLPRP